MGAEGDQHVVAAGHERRLGGLRGWSIEDGADQLHRGRPAARDLQLGEAEREHPLVRVERLAAVVSIDRGKAEVADLRAMQTVDAALERPDQAAPRRVAQAAELTAPGEPATEIGRRSVRRL